MTKADTEERLLSPGLAWEPGRTPFAQRFGDIYYSRESGLAEARHVFLGGCGLPEHWRDTDVFVVGELGFGTGLNFLATWELWRRTRREGARLHYLSVEGYPLTRNELRECLDAWPELGDLSRALHRAYPHPQPGCQRLFPAPGVCLTLLFGEALDMLTQLECSVDAWFLDGFSPDKNPAMWRREIFAELARLSHPSTHTRDGTRLATYSVAGEVRRSLGEMGFDVARAPGFGQKREMLRGTFQTTPQPITPRLQPWFARAPAASSTHHHAAVIGAGIAGANVAYALNRRGWRTTIVDRQPILANETSGNSVGVLMPRLTAAPALDGRFYASAWRFALDTFDSLAETAPFLHQRCGVLQLARDAAEASRLAAVATSGTLPDELASYVTADEASAIAGSAVPNAALYFPQGGWVSPRELCASLAAGSDLRLGVDVAGLRHAGGLWQVIDRDGMVRVEADVVVLANALGALTLAQGAWLPVEARRGQISLVPATATSAALRSVLIYGGYITPAVRGAHTVGATFHVVGADAVNDPADVRPADHDDNLAALAAVLPELIASVDPASLHGRAGVRCTSPDHLPLVGAMPDRDAFLRDFAELRHGHPWTRYPKADYHAGLFALVGLGSRGLVAAPLAAELLACHITGEPWPLERDLVTALHPGRFLVRELRRREA